MKINRPYRTSTIPGDAELKFEGVIFDVYQWEQELYDGSKTTFERLARPDTVVAFPVLKDKRILLIEDTQPARETILTAPAGRIEEGETPEEAAKRELKEETGFEPESLSLLYSYQPFTKIDWVIHVFVARGCTKTVEPSLEPGEKNVPRPVTFDELIDLVKNGGYDKDRFDTYILKSLLNGDLNSVRNAFGQGD